MEFKDIIAEYEEDIKWDRDKCDKYLMIVPSLIAKYQGYWFKMKKQLDKLEAEHDDKWIVRFQYYKHDFDIKLTNSEIRDFLTKDKELTQLKNKARSMLINVEYIEKCLKNIDSIRWDIKNYLDYQKFISGVM